MTARLRIFAVLSTLVLLIAACGGTDDAGGDTNGNGGDSGAITDQDGPSGDGSAASGGSDDTDDPASGDTDRGDTGATNNSGPPDLDAGNMPPAGEVTLDVDGQVFTVRADDMDYFICELTGDFINVRSEGPTQDITIQYDPNFTTGNVTWILGDGTRYDSFFNEGTGGGAAVEAPHLVYEAQFNTSTAEDPFAANDVGVGRVEVTCP